MDHPIGLDAAALRSSGTGPLFARIAAALESRIVGGELARGTRLPAERDLATLLGVNRATVGRAYRALESKGLVASRVGSGTVVTSPADPGATGDAPAPGPGAGAGPPLARGARALARSLDASLGPGGSPGSIDFSRMYPDVEMFPRDRLEAAAAAALARGAEVLQYGSPAGLPELRALVAGRVSRLGIPAAPEEVLIVNGIQQALDLLAKTLLDDGDRVVVESPTYANLLPLLRLYGAEIAGVPLDAEGMALGPLEAALDAHRPKLVYTIPSFHNPTGMTMSRARREAVVRACRSHGTLLVEDGYEEQLRYWGDPLPPLAALAAPDGVAYLGTFSKGLFPGLRLGFIVARGELLAMLTLVKRFTDYHADLLSQAVLGEILASGDYDRHLDRLRRVYRGRMRRTLDAMEKHFPPGASWHAPEGGYSAWVTLPHGVRASSVAERARERGVLVLPGGPFFDGSPEGERSLRLSISQTDPGRIEEGLERLGQVLADAIARDGRAGPGHDGPPLV